MVPSFVCVPPPWDAHIAEERDTTCRFRPGPCRAYQLTLRSHGGQVPSVLPALLPFACDMPPCNDTRTLFPVQKNLLGKTCGYMWVHVGLLCG